MNKENENKWLDCIFTRHGDKVSCTITRYNREEMSFETVFRRSVKLNEVSELMINAKDIYLKFLEEQENGK